jgi:hypothetical protein
MKSEERHELNENALQSWLQYGLPLFLKDNVWYILFAISLGALAWSLWNRHEQTLTRTAQTASSELAAAERPGVENRAVKLQTIIQQYDVPPVRALALRDLGNYYLESVALGKTDASPAAARVDPVEALAKAKENFDRVLKEFPDQLLAAGSAKLGLAVIAENNGDWDAARKIYEELSSKNAPMGKAFAAIAADKLQQLDSLKNAPPLAALAPPPPSYVIPQASSQPIVPPLPGAITPTLPEAFPAPSTSQPK